MPGEAYDKPPSLALIPTTMGKQFGNQTAHAPLLSVKGIFSVSEADIIRYANPLLYKRAFTSRFFCYSSASKVRFSLPRELTSRYRNSVSNSGNN